MTDRFRIRPATVLDAALLAALHRASCTANWDEAWSQRSFADVTALPGGLGLIAESLDAPLGFALGRRAADEAEVLLIATHPSERRHGVARGLLQDLMRRLADAGARRVFLEVAEPNAAALGLYRQAGFRSVGRRPNYYRARAGASGPAAVDAVLLSRDLTDISTAP
jgi:[ribosomal protein S18]-alanine N-acetyltransferase